MSASMRNLSFRLVAACLVLAAIWSCKENSPAPTFTELRFDEICTLDQSEHPIGRLYSMAVSKEQDLLLCTKKGVFKYSKDGKYVCQIGSTGRAEKEYIMPMLVRACGEKVYVWDGMTLRFLVYDWDGNYEDSFTYESGVNDFLPFGDNIFISPGGVRNGYVIDVYDTGARCVADSLVKSSEAYRSMRMWSVSPIARTSESLYFMPKDQLDVHKAYLQDVSKTSSFTFESQSFCVPEVGDSKALVRNDSKFVEFLDRASFVVALFPDKKGKNIKVLTSEGEYTEDQATRMANRYYTVYDVVNGKLKNSYSFHHDVIVESSLICNVDGEMCFLRNEIQEGSSEETWTLCKAKL